MNIVTVCFERKKEFAKLLKVFQKSAKATMPNVNLKIIKPVMPENRDNNKYRRRKRDNAFAFATAARYALKSKELIAVADVDLMFIKSIEDVADLDFDIAITVRPKQKRAKYNTGLWFLKPSERSKLFIRKWIQKTNYLMKNFVRFTDYILSKSGIDQASLCMTMDRIKDIKIIELPCQEWNATQSEWENVNEKTRVIHIKSQLRLAVFNKKKDIAEYMFPLIKIWKGFLK